MSPFLSIAIEVSDSYLAAVRNLLTQPCLDDRWPRPFFTEEAISMVCQLNFCEEPNQEVLPRKFAINEDASFKDHIGMTPAVTPQKFARLRRLPRVDREAERLAFSESWYEAGHCREKRGG